MIKKVFPNKLQKGDEVRIVAPARSLSMISKELKEIASNRFKKLGLKLSFGKYVKKSDDFVSSNINSRVFDLQEAFKDKKVKAIITVIGGFNSNQLLADLDWNIIKNNPKIFCGFSDITSLGNSIYSKTGLVTYSGPHYSTFGQKLYFDYTLEYFKKCLMSNDAFQIKSSNQWNDDEWYLDQDKRSLIDNDGFKKINQGEVKGTIIGGNLCTLNLLQGTKYMPSFKDSILFLEDDYESSPHHFDRNLQSLIHQDDFSNVKGLVIGRFQKESKMIQKLLKQIISSKKELKSLPVIANVDFGHTDPKITFPIGGVCELTTVGNKEIKLNILSH